MAEHFDVIRMRSIIIGYGQMGLPRIAASLKLFQLLNRLHCGRIHEFVLSELGFGLHIIATGKLKP